MDSYYLSLLEGAGGVQRERLPGGLGQTQLAAGGSNESGGVVRNVFENCAGGGVNFPGESQFLLDSIPQKSGCRVWREHRLQPHLRDTSRYSFLCEFFRGDSRNRRCARL